MTSAGRTFAALLPIVVILVVTYFAVRAVRKQRVKDLAHPPTRREMQRRILTLLGVVVPIEVAAAAVTREWSALLWLGVTVVAGLFLLAKAKPPRW